MLGRPDHGMFLSMWACLWGMVVDKFDMPALMQCFKNGGLAQEVRRHRALTGWAPHPFHAASVFAAPKNPATAAKAHGRKPDSAPARASKTPRRG